MALLIPSTWLWGLAAAAWFGAALHTGLTMRRYGRRWWVWLLISVFFTVIPAAIVSYVDYFGRLRRMGRRPAPRADGGRCPHCGAEPTWRHVRRAGGRDVCGRCGMLLDDEARA